MRRRGFYFFLTAGLVLITATIIALAVIGRGPITPPQPVFPDLADRLGELAWIQVARGTTKVDFANVAGRWVVVEKDNYPADPARLQRLLSGLAALIPVKPRAPQGDQSSAVDRDDAAGVAPTLITLRGRVGDTVAKAIVTSAPSEAAADGAAAVYVRRPGAELAILARGALEMPGDPLGWLDRDIIDLPQARVASLRLTAADGATLAIRRESADAAFAVVDLPVGARLKSDIRFSDLAETLAGLAFDDVKPRALIDLPETGFLRAAFVTFDGLAIELRLFAYQGADWIAIASSGTGAAEAEGKALNDKFARWVYAIPAPRAKLLRTRLDDLTEPAKGL